MDDKQAKKIIREFSRLRKERDRYEKLWLKSKLGSIESTFYAKRRDSAQNGLKEMAGLRTKAFSHILTAQLTPNQF